MKHGIRAMLPTGGGSIVNWSSVGGLNGSACTSVYQAAKHGIIGASKSAAIEYGTQGIRVNTICPGFILTEIMARGGRGLHPRHRRQGCPQPRRATPRGGRGGRLPGLRPGLVRHRCGHPGRRRLVGQAGVAEWSAVRTAEEADAGDTGPTGRPYDGTLRRERAAETRERILDAGSELLHRTSVRDWKKLTVRAVAERAGVNERTVYRYFGSERGLRDAVMHRNEQEAGIDLDGMQLEDIATVAAQIFDHVAQYPREPRPPLDPTLVEAKDRQHEALLGAVAAEAGQWPTRTGSGGGGRARRALERGRLRAPGRRLGDRPRAGRRGASPGSSDWSRRPFGTVGGRRDGRTVRPRPTAQPAASSLVRIWSSEDLPDRASGHRPSVHRDHDAGDLGRAVAGQEEHGLGHVLRRPLALAAAGRARWSGPGRSW